MTRITIKRPGPDGIVIGAMIENGLVHLYPSKAATDAERADMERARSNLVSTPNHPALIARWLRGKGYTVEMR